MDWLRSVGSSIAKGFEQFGSELGEFASGVATGAQRTVASINYVEPFERIAQGARDLYIGAEKWITGPTGEPSARVKGLDFDYRAAHGQLFVTGQGDLSDIDPNDISQGKLADCYFLASLAAVAKTRPDAIRRMIRENEDGTYTVTLNVRRLPWEPGGDFKKVGVTISGELPFHGDRPAFARSTDGVAEGTPELWVSLIEKAWASYQGRYAHIENGFSGHAMELITGVPSRSFPPHMLSLEQLDRYERDGYALTVSTAMDLRIGPLDLPDITSKDPLFKNGTLEPGHVYFIESVDPRAGTVTIRNPWGPQHPPIVLTEDQLHRLCSDVSLNPTR